MAISSLNEEVSFSALSFMPRATVTFLFSCEHKSTKFCISLDVVYRIDTGLKNSKFTGRGGEGGTGQGQLPIV